MTKDNEPTRARALSLPLALILAGGLAAGIGLARPGNDGPATPAGVVPATDEAGDPVTADQDDSYRQGNRTAGDRGAAAPAQTPVPVPIPGDGDNDSDGDAGQAAAPTAAITIENFAFTGPTSVAPGTALTITNRDGAAHTLSFRSGEADTGTVEGGATASLAAPSAPGTHAYFCRIHPSMEGEIEITG